MALTLWCRWPDCRKGYASVEEIPPICPACGREADWTTREQPRVAFKLTRDDVRFLRMLRIRPDVADQHLGASEEDGA